MMLAYSAGGSGPFASGATVGSVSDMQFPERDAECRSDTLGVSFHGPWLTSHSAEQLAHSFARVEGCEIALVRLTALVPEEASEAELRDAETRRGELALHIEALVGPSRARELPMRADVRSSITDPRLRSHALLRIERRPAGGAEIPALSAFAAPDMSTSSPSAGALETDSGSALVGSLNP